MVRGVGWRARTVILTVLAVLFFASLPSVATGMKIVSADGSARLACSFYGEWPDESALDGMVSETAFRYLETDVAPLWGHLNCTFRHSDGEVFWESRVVAMPVAGVVACYSVALTIVAAAWLMRPKRWVQRQ